MPTGVYIRTKKVVFTKEHRLRIGLANRGKVHQHSKQTRTKLSLSLKKYYESHRGHGLGTKLSDEHKRKISAANRGRKLTGAALDRRIILNRLTGLNLRGKTSPNLGKENLKIRGTKHWNWKGGISADKSYRSWSSNKRNRLKRILNNSGSHHTFEEWVSLKNKYNNECLHCHRAEPEIKLTEDHIIPLSRGGDDGIKNIQPLCLSCNCKKSNKIINQ